ncbi:hypothetical protein F444_20943 [Phytophthora nicotianae P1976]|uniref:HTH CENPB-type domain-containing protein n=1 Tax=Phytophthora nicotianae P1976 TaxID=1317066 RepID=A0A080Z2Q0_PHYNI|nr:hypothetical protein F444_20943 [Phytophthora nicotianae P1976]
MYRPHINDQGNKRNAPLWNMVTNAMFSATSTTVTETMKNCYGEFNGNEVRLKNQINNWMKQTATIRAACESGLNLCSLGDATVLSKDAEASIVFWLNSQRKIGAPVSRLMLQLHAKDVATEVRLGDKFGATST